ncbi:MAG TPA: hypothetical protein DF863_02570 [Gammaproteobacteria bacterium]|jgi:CRP-like cAMP-binding protein|nr:hypothetical protein [Gammaproteobacteria bacterium]|tara:strand:- start:1070 stop:1786 length:717 start_codon:yes stop_codon:yes gene_type:complete
MNSDSKTGEISYQSLCDIRILASLTEQEFTQLAGTCAWHRHRPGQEIVVQDTPCDEVYFICSGRVSAKTYSTTGKEVTYAELHAGDHFGELSALDGQPRVSFVVTLEESLLSSLSAEAFNAFLEAHPGVMRALLTDLAGRVRALDEKIFEFSTLSSRNRIHAELLRLADPQRHEDGSAEIAPPPTHADLASRTNTTRESVTRELNRLKKAGLLEADRSHYKILNVAALADLVNRPVEL